VDRAVGVDLELYNREETRLVVLVPQHQTAMYETYNKKSYKLLKVGGRARDQLNALYRYALEVGGGAAASGALGGGAAASGTL
jgi:hypothetical protein